VATERVYTQTGAFSYGSPAPAGAVYPTGRVRSGDAVFVRLVPRLQVGFDWQLVTRERHRVRGRASLAAEVSDGAGWTSQLVLVPPRAFTGDRTTVTGVLDVAALRRLVRSFERATGATAGTYQVRVVPTVELDGSVAGNPVSDRFAPPLELTLDQTRLRLAESTDPSWPNGLSREQASAGNLLRPTELGLLGRRVPLSTVRLLATVGLGVAFVALLVLLRLARAVPGLGGGEELARSLRGRPVVNLASEPEYGHALQVASLDELVRLAEQSDRVILRHESSGVFVVEDDGITYAWWEPAAGGAPLLALRSVDAPANSSRVGSASSAP
jgi:hypothetical protein